MEAPVPPTALLENQATEAFTAMFGPPPSIVAESLRASLRFLRIDMKKRELVLDKRALLLGLLAVGAKPEARSASSSASALLAWLQAAGIRVQGMPTDVKEIELATRSCTLVLSVSVQRAVLPRAQEIARIVGNTPAISVRHVTVALLEELDGSITDIFTRTLTEEERRAAIRYVIDWNMARPSAGETREGWQRVRGEVVDDAADALENSAAEPEPIPAPSPDPEPAPITPTPRPESLRTLSDQPATTDRLGREAFATVLAERLRDGREAGGGEGALMAHIHGPWGYGKSSALNFLKQRLESGDDPWLVVEFNAWKHHRIRPPWWSLISAIYEAARKAPEIRSNGKLWRIWWGWRMRADWGPIALVALLIATGAAGALTSADATVKLVSGMITAGAAIFAATRVLSFGSAKAAQAYAELKTDPYQPVVRLYCQLVEAIGRPVAVFVDDIDRCEGSYVVELIEGIQTLLRQEPVTYVIAAERKWICSAFEKKYADFTAPIGEPARPLGYLFLDKLFQISAPLPGLSPEMRKGYWAGLLDTAPAAAAPLSAQEAAKQVAGAQTLEALNQVIAEAPEAQKPQLRAAAAMEITQSRHSEAIEHRLQSFADLLEPNPRAMKRLVNAIGMAQARAFLEGRNVALDTLTRWTLIELRWPLLADHLAGNVALIAALRGDAEAPTLPVHLAPLATDRQLRAIVVPEDGPGLDAVQLQALLA